jgi:hypothetical protein
MSLNGLIIVSNISTKTTETEEGSFNRFIMEYICNWFLGYKDHSQLKDVMESAGAKAVSVDNEPLGYHLLAQGKK